MEADAGIEIVQGAPGGGTTEQVANAGAVGFEEENGGGWGKVSHGAMGMRKKVSRVLPGQISPEILSD